MWTILGAGAIGGLLACQLQRAGIPVQLALRPPPDQKPPPARRDIVLVANGDACHQNNVPAGRTLFWWQTVTPAG